VDRARQAEAGRLSSVRGSPRFSAGRHGPTLKSTSPCCVKQQHSTFDTWRYDNEHDSQHHNQSVRSDHASVRPAPRGSRLPSSSSMKGIMYDSWPVPGVARFQDPAVTAATTRRDVLAARRVSVVNALGRPASEAEITEYLDPWTDPGLPAPGWRSRAPRTTARLLQVADYGRRSPEASKDPALNMYRD
jgi:hypothetical protein